MRVAEVIIAPASKAKKRAPQAQSDFEKNAAALRSKERRLKARSPVPPVKHRP